MSKRIVSTPRAPAAIGAYSQATLAGGWLWCSGQIALDPETGKMVGQGTDEAAAKAQAQRVLHNLRSVVEAADGSFDDVVRCTVYLADLSHFAAVNEVYEYWFGTASPPARATVEVSALPKDALVEISCVARIGSAGDDSGASWHD